LELGGELVAIGTVIYSEMPDSLQKDKINYDQFDNPVADATYSFAIYHVLCDKPRSGMLHHEWLLQPVFGLL